MNTVFTYQDPTFNYLIEVILADNIERVTFGTTITITDYRFRISRWVWNGIEYARDEHGAVMPEEQRNHLFEERRSLQEIFQGINKRPGIPIPANLEQAIILGGTGSFHDMLNV